MAAPAKHPLPCHQMRVMLAASKRAGVPFDRAWASAYERVRWPHDTGHRTEWKAVLIETQVVWERAYTQTRQCPVENFVTGMALEAA